MHVPRPLILGGMLAAGGFLGWAMNTYSDEAAQFVLASSGSADLPVSQPASQPAETQHSGMVVRLVIVTDDSAAAEAAEAAEADAQTAPAATVEPAPAMSSDSAAERSSTADGDHIVVAHDRSVVFIGDDGELNANAGDVSSSGVLAIDAQQSTLETGDATTTPAQPDAQPTMAPLDSEQSALDTAAARTSLAQQVGPHASLGRGDGRATALAGWEDHSLLVAGKDQVVTYDDSNVFIDRDGKLNMNTGDTDSSGLNVVDASRSRVGTGNHIEDGEADDEEEEEEEEEVEGELSAGNGTSSSVASQTTLSTMTPSSSASVADEGDSAATGRDAFVVGADGVDDLAVDVFGQRNVVTYDDSNVAVGGTGDVNAQIGDSDTSGAVVMGVTDSVIASGNST